MEISLFLPATRTNPDHSLYVDDFSSRPMPCLAIPNHSFLTSTIIVLNKCDLLQAKLQRGIRIRDSVPSFGERNNNLQTATQCKHINCNKNCVLLINLTHPLDFQQHFKDVARRCSPVKRRLYVHLTSVIVGSVSFSVFILRVS